VASESGGKAVLAALAANLGIAATKMVAYLLTGAAAMLAESIHSVADSGNQVLLLIGGRRARQSATPEHPFGYGRVRYLYAFVVSVVLFTVGGLFALYEAWHKWQHPEPITGWRWVPIVVLVVAIGLESFSFRTAIIVANPLRHGRSWVAYVRGAKAPELPVVLLEDLAALLGLVFALLGVGLTLATENGRWDAAGTALIGLLLVAVATVLAIEMSSLLVGEGANPDVIERVRAALRGPGVTRVIHLRTLHLGPDELLIAAKVAVPPGGSAQQVAEAIDDAEARVRSVLALDAMIFLEPDIDREPAAAAADPTVPADHGRNLG
jgi:cation diffusion facilitator family transporter